MVVRPLDLAPPALIETRNQTQHAAEPMARDRELVPGRVDHLLLDRKVVGRLFHFEVGLDGAGVGGAVGAVGAEVEQGADCERGRSLGLVTSVSNSVTVRTRRGRTVGRRHVAVRATLHAGTESTRQQSVPNERGLDTVPATYKVDSQPNRPLKTTTILSISVVMHAVGI